MSEEDPKVAHLKQKPPTREDEYFAKEERERLERLRAQKTEQEEREERDRQREQHWMRCPKCGSQLVEETHHSVQIDVCHSCHGLWLDQGELEQITSQEAGFASGFLKWFKK